MCRLDREEEHGNVEYKWKLEFRTKRDFDKRKTQMAFRVEEGNGTAFYYLGVMDDGLCAGLSYKDLLISEQNLIRMADDLDFVVLFNSTIPTISPHDHARKYKIIRSDLFHNP